MTASLHPGARTLWLCGMLHAFTHLYHVALIPLYLPIQQDFKLGSVEPVTLLVTVLLLAYFVPAAAAAVRRMRLETLPVVEAKPTAPSNVLVPA